MTINILEQKQAIPNKKSLCHYNYNVIVNLWEAHFKQLHCCCILFQLRIPHKIFSSDILTSTKLWPSRSLIQPRS